MCTQGILVGNRLGAGPRMPVPDRPVGSPGRISSCVFTAVDQGRLVPPLNYIYLALIAQRRALGDPHVWVLVSKASA